MLQCLSVAVNRAQQVSPRISAISITCERPCSHFAMQRPNFVHVVQLLRSLEMKIAKSDAQKYASQRGPN